MYVIYIYIYCILYIYYTYILKYSWLLYKDHMTSGPYFTMFWWSFIPATYCSPCHPVTCKSWRIISKNRSRAGCHSAAFSPEQGQLILFEHAKISSWYHNPIRKVRETTTKTTTKILNQLLFTPCISFKKCVVHLLTVQVKAFWNCRGNNPWSQRRLPHGISVSGICGRWTMTCQSLPRRSLPLDQYFYPQSSYWNRKHQLISSNCTKLMQYKSF